jgi:hypothetical protein
LIKHRKDAKKKVRVNGPTDFEDIKVMSELPHTPEDVGHIHNHQPQQRITPLISNCETESNMDSSNGANKKDFASHNPGRRGSGHLPLVYRPYLPSSHGMRTTRGVPSLSSIDGSIAGGNSSQLLFSEDVNGNVFVGDKSSLQI